MLIAPPAVFLPYRVPCGPSRISTRSTSYIAVVRNPGKLANTSSRYVPTPLLLFMLKSSRPMPRMRNSGVLSVVAFMVDRLGETLERLSGCWIRSVCSASPLTAVIATPTSCADWLRRCAVTSTSSRAVSASPAGATTGTSSVAARAQTDPRFKASTPAKFRRCSLGRRVVLLPSVVAAAMGAGSARSKCRTGVATHQFGA